MSESTRVRFLATLVNGYPFSSDDFSNDLRENDIPLARIRDIKNPAFTTFIDRNKVPEEVVIQNGDLVIGMDGDFNSKIWDKGPAALNQRMCLLRSLDSKTLRFISYAIPDQLEFINELTYSTTVKHLSSEQVLGLPLPDLDLKQRHAIADYLDRETAEIDGMRADLDEMERLLETRREAMIRTLISSAPSAYYPIAVAADITLGKMVQPTKKSSSERQAPYLRAAHVPQPGALDTSVEYKEMWFSPKEMELLTIRKGDVVVVEGGAGYGRSALIEDDLKGWGFQNSIVRIRAFESLAHGPFIAYALRHAHAIGQIEIAASTATLPHFTAEKVSRFRIPLPPLAEQRRIADEIDRETAEIDSMLEDITKLRDLLVERRAAVISAAVTGQIDIPVSLDDKDEPHA